MIYTLYFSGPLTEAPIKKIFVGFFSSCRAHSPSQLVLTCHPWLGTLQTSTHLLTDLMTPLLLLLTKRRRRKEIPLTTPALFFEDLLFRASFHFLYSTVRTADSRHGLHPLQPLHLRRRLGNFQESLFLFFFALWMGRDAPLVSPPSSFLRDTDGDSAPLLPPPPPPLPPGLGRERLVPEEEEEDGRRNSPFPDFPLLPSAVRICTSVPTLVLLAMDYTFVLQMQPV